MNPYPRHQDEGAAQPRGPRTTRTKVTFENDKPQVVTLEFDPPTEPREGNWGPQYMYFLSGEQIGFFEPAVHAQIVALDCHAGDTIAITKRKAGRANRWEVNAVVNGRMITVGEPAREAAHQLASAPRAIRETAPPPIRPGNESASTTGNTMAHALTQAMEACKLSGFEEASREDIRALAITIYITLSGGRK